VNLRKVALDAATDQALAIAATERHRDDIVLRLLGELAEGYAQLLAEQFPGQEELAGRLLVSAGTLLAGAVEQGMPSMQSVTVALTFTGESLYRKGAR
jgi:hypothetical protein